MKNLDPVDVFEMMEWNDEIVVWKRKGWNLEKRRNLCYCQLCYRSGYVNKLKVMIVKLFYKCCINNAIDGSEDAFMYERDDENSSIPNLFFVIRKKQKWTSSNFLEIQIVILILKIRLLLLNFFFLYKFLAC